MVPHVLIVDDEEDVLEALVPGFIEDVAQAVERNPAARPAQGRLWTRVHAHGYSSSRLANPTIGPPAKLVFHLCCERGGRFVHVPRLLRDHFVAVLVSDLRFSAEPAGAKAGRGLLDDVARRHPETQTILSSAYEKPDGVPAERFLRKSHGPALVAAVVAGLVKYQAQPAIVEFNRLLAARGLGYQSAAFGTLLKRLTDLARLHFQNDPPDAPEGRRQPRPMILLDGESGTGKTELAGLLHQLSPRRSAPFVVSNCQQLLNEQFLRSALFGHVKGAFSGATADRPGLVAQAKDGVLLLDDLHMIQEEGAAILHSFLDDGEYCRLGQDETRRRSPAALVATVETPRWRLAKAEERLPASFFARVEQLVVPIPPLRDRPEDIRRQAADDVARFAAPLGEAMELSAAAADWLVAQDWEDGNSRRLRDFARSLVLENAGVTDYLDLPEMIAQARRMGMEQEPSQVAVAASAPAESSAWPLAAADPDGWAARMERLTAAALARERDLDAPAAIDLAKELLSGPMQDIWAALETLAQRGGWAAKNGAHVKLVEELVRYFAVGRFGNPAKAARELGLRDNALREFLASRAAKRPGG